VEGVEGGKKVEWTRRCTSDVLPTFCDPSTTSLASSVCGRRRRCGGCAFIAPEPPRSLCTSAPSEDPSEDLSAELYDVVVVVVVQDIINNDCNYSICNAVLFRLQYADHAESSPARLAAAG